MRCLVLLALASFALPCLAASSPPAPAPAPNFLAAPTWSTGPLVNVIRLGLTSEGGLKPSALTSVGWQGELNLVQDRANPGIRWVTLSLFLTAGVQPAADGSGQAGDVSMGVAIGGYNNAVSLGFGGELLDVALSPEARSSGLLFRPLRTNLFFTLSVGFSLAQWLTPATLGASPRDLTAPTVLPPFYVR